MTQPADEPQCLPDELARLDLRASRPGSLPHYCRASPTRTGSRGPSRARRAIKTMRKSGVIPSTPSGGRSFRGGGGQSTRNARNATRTGYGLPAGSGRRSGARSGRRSDARAVMARRGARPTPFDEDPVRREGSVPLVSRPREQPPVSTRIDSGSRSATGSPQPTPRATAGDPTMNRGKTSAWLLIGLLLAGHCRGRTLRDCSSAWLKAGKKRPAWAGRSWCGSVPSGARGAGKRIGRSPRPRSRRRSGWTLVGARRRPG